jgi:hypothetical protein
MKKVRLMKRVMKCLMIFVVLSIVSMMYIAFNFEAYRGITFLLSSLSILTTAVIFYTFYLVVKYVLNLDQDTEKSEDVGNILMSFVYNGKKHIKIV